MSTIHLITCLIVFALWYYRKLSIPVALSAVALVAQTTIIGRLIYFAQMQPEQFLQFILLNQITSLLAVVFLVICFVKYTPFVISIISLSTYASVVVYLKEPVLWNIFIFFLGVHFFLCMLGELLRRNVLFVQAENADLHERETALMHAVRLNQREIEAYLRMSSNSQPTPDDTDRLFSMLKPSSQRNHLLDDSDLASLFPTLTKSEVDVCNLIVQGKKRSEICQLLDKTEKNVDVVRAHIRKKLNVPGDQDLRKYIIELLLEKQQ